VQKTHDKWQHWVEVVSNQLLQWAARLLCWGRQQWLHLGHKVPPSRSRTVLFYLV
jgi:hypothetical protein